MARVAYVDWNPSLKSRELYNERVQEQEDGRDQLSAVAENWNMVVEQFGKL